MENFNGILSGDRRLLARLLRSLEDDDASLREAFRNLFHHSGRSRIIGLTGPAGAGKSTLADRLISHYRDLGKRVGVLAVDPSSQLSGGAFLGDRIRMQRHSLDSGVFIHSIAARGHLGGVTRHALCACCVLDAAGYEIILVETTGVGQAESEISRLADTTVLVTVPEGGDHVQALKAGIIEIADIIVVNKSDRDEAGRAVTDLESALALSAGGRGKSPPPVLPIAAKTGKGLSSLAKSLDMHAGNRGACVGGEAKVLERWRYVLLGLIAERVCDTVVNCWDEKLSKAAYRLAAREGDPIDEAEKLLGQALETIYQRHSH